MPLPVGPMGLSTGSACAHLAHSLGIPSSWLCRPALTLGVINPTRFRPSPQPPRSTGPLLHQGYSVPGLHATTTRSADLTSSACFPSVSGYTVSLYPTTQSGLPMRPSLLWVNTPSLRAATHTPRGETKKPQPSSVPSGLPHKFTESAPLPPRHLFLSGFVHDAAMFA